MPLMKPTACVALLGDLVASREAPDRSALHRHLLQAIRSANAGPQILDPLRVTAGDEFQGVFASVGAALAATFTLRAALHPAQARFGLGIGSVQIIDAETNVQDGSAWWAARSAIEAVEEAAHGAHRANRAVHARHAGQGGSTLVAGLLVKNRPPLWLSVGDSR